MDLVILENFSCLTENNVSDIEPALKWFEKLKDYGIAVLVVDHPNKKGELEGREIKKRAASTVIELERIGEDQIKVSFPTGGKSLHGNDIDSFTLQMVCTENEFRLVLINGRSNDQNPSKNIELWALAMFLVKQEIPYGRIAELIDRSKATISNIRNKYTVDLNQNGNELYSQELNRLEQKYAELESQGMDDNAIYETLSQDYKISTRKRGKRRIGDVV